MNKIILTVLLLTMSTFAQEIKNAPGDYQVKIIDSFCYAIYKKGEKKTFQLIEIYSEEESSKKCSENVQTENAETVDYDEQTEIFIDDYNFDGLMDLALYEGNTGGYGAPSYQIYLFSKTNNKFVKNVQFSKLSQYQGMFDVNKRNKMLYVYSKSGCCFHQKEGYKVVKNKPLKVYVNTVESSPSDEVIVTTKKLINGKWRTWDKRSAVRVSFEKGKTSHTITVKLTKNDPIKWLKFSAAKGQILTVTKNTLDAEVSLIDFKGDVSSYESYQPLKEGENFPVKLLGKGEYFLEVSAEKNLNLSLTIKIENEISQTTAEEVVSLKYSITPTSAGNFKLE